MDGVASTDGFVHTDPYSSRQHGGALAVFWGDGWNEAGYLDSDHADSDDLSLKQDDDAQRDDRAGSDPLRATA